MIQSMLDYILKYELIIENSYVSCFRYVMKYELITENIYTSCFKLFLLAYVIHSLPVTNGWVRGND